MQAETLIQAARQHAGVDAALDQHTIQGLEAFVDAANREADLSPDGEQRIAGLVVGALANRLRVENYLSKHPELLEKPVEKPMFVFGLPRTGTTLTINLLNKDPARRCFLRWEAFNSVPPPKAGRMYSDPRFIEEQARIDEAARQAPEMSAIHHEDADSPSECQMSMLQAMCSQVLEALVHVPSYREWYLDTSYVSTFQYHKRLLQLLQSESPGRWTLKNPWHPLFLEDLMTVYPDAQLVMNHRDPVDVMGSSCSMLDRVRSPYVEKVNKELIAETLLDTFDIMIQRTLTFREEHGEDSIYDLQYVDLLANPIGEMKKLYQHFDEPFTGEAEQAMEDFQARNPKGKHGSHSYSLEEFGLTREQVRQHFRPYCERFGIPCKD